MSNALPGFYPAQGDPSGTVRYWDGNQWASDPVPPPPGYQGPDAQGRERFARLGVRIGAQLLDSVVSTIVLLPFVIPYFLDVFDDIDAGGDGTSVPVPASLYAGSAVILVLWVVTTARLGATPGKLMVGLRITEADATTTPLQITRAALRYAPVAIGVVPILGPLISMGFSFASLFMVFNDPERRSAYDRLAGTRVVHKRYL